MATRFIILFTFLALMVLSLAPRLTRGFIGERLMIDMLDIGQGDAIMVSYGNDRVLIDGGPGHNIGQSIAESLPIFGVEFDALFLTHPHADHIDGLFDVMARYSVLELVVPDVKRIGEVGRMPLLINDANERGVKIRYVAKGDVVEIGNLVFDVLSPERGVKLPSDLNDVSLVMILRDMDGDGDNEAVFTGDAGFDVEKKVLGNHSDFPDVEFLKIGHHGSATSTGDDFLGEFNPRFVGISVGEKNRYGHPSKALLSRVKKVGSEIFMTKDAGTVSWVLSGGCLRVAGVGGGFNWDFVQFLFLKKSYESCTIAAI